MGEEFNQALTSFVLELVQIKSVNGQDLDGETAVATKIYKEATKLGLEAQVILNNILQNMVGVIALTLLSS